MAQTTPNTNGGYIAPLSSHVERTKTTFRNRFGLSLAGDLYTARSLDRTTRHPALIVGAPYGGVKEQGPCIYANELAQRGFVVLTFDQANMGESSGEPRNLSSPELFTESFSAAVDYLGLQPYIDRERIGVIGICGSGGFALSAAQSDTRIRAVATVSMYGMTAAARHGLTPEQVAAAKERISRQRWVDAEQGYPERITYFPAEPLDSVPADLPEPTAEWFRFYALKRGHHVRARGGFTTTSDMSFITFNLLSHLDEISPRPILFIVGDRAHSRFYSDHAYEKAAEPKEMYVVEDAEHIDLYDRTDRIPFDKVESFLRTSM